MVIKITCQQVGLRRPDRPLILPTFSAAHHIPLSVHDQRKTGNAALPVFRLAAHSVTTGVHITLLGTNFLSKFSSKKSVVFLESFGKSFSKTLKNLSRVTNSFYFSVFQHIFKSDVVLLALQGCSSSTLSKCAADHISWAKIIGLLPITTSLHLTKDYFDLLHPS
ncbi:hypothetical protein LWC05_05280 [Acetobacter sicerae]|uniref:Uncharacterized protein n=1 Tax=Acetobacter sicerae TaxID=85325 RepID=A0ABS8VUL0_9PROT|nr:hypothetical protein [Acetobacter sicerae]MCE0743304.1 hypothetical protein [Acetobacter sicerae]